MTPSSPPAAPTRAPLVTGAVLFVLSLAWAWNLEQAAHARERDQLVRFTDGLARGLEPLAAQSPDDAALAAQVRSTLRLQRPFLFAALVRGDAVVVSLGDETGAVALTPGLSPDGARFVVRRRLGPPPPGESRRLSAPWSWSGTGATRSLADLELVAGFDPSINTGARREAWTRMALGLLLAWAGIGALVLAWRRWARERHLAVSLEHERRERERLAELGLAAAGLAHETKNPLGLILGIAQRLHAAPDTGPAAREAAEQIMDAADRAAARLGDFLHFARLPTPHLAPVDAGALLRRLVATLMPDFQAAQVGLAVELEPLTLECDAGMLEQLVVNLLLNALQASPAGTRTTLRLARDGQTARLSVVDEGRGVDEALRGAAFKPYVTGRADGHGLGLAIVKRIVEQHGWAVSLENRATGGAEVHVTGLRLVTGGHA